MTNQITVPSLGESITEATVSRWLKQVGEKVNTDEPLVELETDKVNVEVPSPLSGTLSSIKVKEGDIVEVGALLGEVEQGKAPSAKQIKKEEPSYVPPKAATKKTTLKKEKPLNLIDEVKEENSSKEALVLDTLAEESVSENKIEKYIPPKTKKNLSPAVRKIVEENNIDINKIEGTGKSG